MTLRSQKQKDKERASLIDSRWVYQGRIIDLRVDTYQFEDKTKIAEVIHHPGAVVIIPIDAKNRILFIQQWRRGAQEILIELPAGTLEENEEPKLCAQRELREEIGYCCHSITALGGFYSTPGFCDEYLHLFVAEKLHFDPLPSDVDEGIDLLPLSLEETLDRIDKNHIRDAKTIAAILRYKLWKKN